MSSGSSSRTPPPIFSRRICCSLALPSSRHGLAAAHCQRHVLPATHETTPTQDAVLQRSLTQLCPHSQNFAAVFKEVQPGRSSQDVPVGLRSLASVATRSRWALDVFAFTKRGLNLASSCSPSDGDSRPNTGDCSMNAVDLLEVGVKRSLEPCSVHDP